MSTEASLLTDAEQLLRHAARQSPAVAARVRDRVVQLHRPLALSLADGFDEGADREQLRDAAVLGLVLAVRRYRPGDPDGFTAYATATIVALLQRCPRGEHDQDPTPPPEASEVSAVPSRPPTD
ncbi:sigma-70 family RNA polymerase sigma factor [Luteipulveratus flavus]|uniref:RNA polymerase sigma-70 region 2 domain-containing protein n=1 Tax=Luteipulveratus flavus TaxID=3031728 RepID=A0ABT6CC59_9MICO|nr:hypothetical protein [Luteipulveratus sp. YIM 133296]MDF8264851.1 hypothetical protein [Luteipulveratus sp. YIM 133296]